MKKLHFFLLLLGFVFLASLVYKLGILALWHELILLGWGLAPFVAMEFVAEAIHTVAWSYCLGKPRRRWPWLLLFRIRMAGNAITYLTPTAALGGEVTKASLLSETCERPEAIGGVLAGRLYSGVGHLLFVAVGSVFVLWSVRLPRPIWAAIFLSGATVAAGMVAFLLLQKYGKLGALIRWLAAREFGGPALRNLAQEISKVDEVLETAYRERPRDLMMAVGWHMVGHSTGLIQTWIFFNMLHHPISAGAVAAVWVLGMWFDMLTFAVPLNMGTLEGSRIVAVTAIGCGAVLGMTYGFALRLAQLSCVGFGLINYTLFFTARSRTNLRVGERRREPVHQ